MIGDFFTKVVVGVKLWRFRIITMSISHDEYEPVDMDELMTIHNEKMLKRFDPVLEGSATDSYKKGEHNINNEQDPVEVSSQECVEDLPKRSNVTWAIVREAHKRPTYNKANIRGHAHQRTYAEVATPTNE